MHSCLGNFSWNKRKIVYFFCVLLCRPKFVYYCLDSIWFDTLFAQNHLPSKVFISAHLICCLEIVYFPIGWVYNVHCTYCLFSATKHNVFFVDKLFPRVFKKNLISKEICICKWISPFQLRKNLSFLFK